MDRVREAVVHGGGQWIHDGIARVTHGARVIAVSGPEAAPHDDGHVRILCAHNPRIWKTSRHAGYDLVLAGHLHGCQLVAWEYRRPPVSGGDLLPVLLLESSAWFDTAGRQPRGQRSRADSLEVSSRSCAVSCLTWTEHGVTARGHGRLRASLVSLTCLLRGLPLFFCAAPKTPLRVLCIVALDTLHVLRHSQPLPRKRISELATFLDFQACTNAAWDRQGSVRGGIPGDPAAAGEGRPGVVDRGIPRRLRELERRRPSIGGDHRRFDEVRSYREAVARLSLATVTAIALNGECLEEGIRATHCDPDVETLFRIVMQCQIIDDVLDYAEDLVRGPAEFSDRIVRRCRRPWN